MFHCHLELIFCISSIALPALKFGFNFRKLSLFKNGLFFAFWLYLVKPIRYSHNGHDKTGHALISLVDPHVHIRQCFLIAFIAVIFYLPVSCLSSPDQLLALSHIEIYICSDCSLQSCSGHLS